MTREQAVKKLEELVGVGAADPEATHAEADDVLCALLVALGYGDVVEAYLHVEKWYS